MKIETCTINCPDTRVSDFLVCGPADDTSVMPQIRRGTYEPSIQKLFCGLVKPGMTVCDIGANFGQHTVLLSRLVGPTGRVFAIEASPTSVEYIRATVNANACDNVEIIKQGVWSHKTQLTFSHVDDAEATSFCSNKENIREIEPNPKCRYQTIEVSSLDDLVNVDIDFCKIDIEGSELFAIKGAKHLLKKQSPILMELNSFTCKTFMGVEIVEIIDYMESSGYYSMYTYNHRQWTSVTKNMLLKIFESGVVLVDVLFAAHQYPPTQFSFSYSNILQTTQNKE